MSEDQSGPCIKGIAFRSAMRSLRELFGDDGVERMLAELPDELASLLRDELMFTANWYPLEWYKQLYCAGQRVTGLGIELPRKLSFENLKKDLSGIYRMFIRFASAEFIMNRAAKLFNTYYDVGSMEIVDSGPDFARVHCKGCVGFDANVWAGVIGSCEAALEVSGLVVTDVKMLKGGGDGDEELIFEGRWKKR